MLLLVNHLHEKIMESQDRQSFDRVHMLLFALMIQLCTCVATLPFC